MAMRDEPGRGKGAARAHGLDRARGAYVLFLGAGDRVAPVALQDWVEAALRFDADITQADYRRGTGPDAPAEPGLTDPALLDPARPPDGPAARGPMGPLPAGPDTALAFGPHLATRLFRRAFLRDAGIAMPAARGASWAFGLSAATRARRAACIAWPGVALAHFDAPGPRPAPGARLAATRRALPRDVARALPSG